MVCLGGHVDLHLRETLKGEHMLHHIQHLLTVLPFILPMFGTITVLGMDGNPFDQNSIEASGARFIRAYCLLKLSGSYATGGDTLDFTNAGGTPSAPSAVPVNTRGLVSIDLRPWSKLTSSFSAADGQYIILAPLGVIPVPLASINALKFKLMLDIGTEYTAGAYGADALGDIIIAESVWAR